MFPRSKRLRRTDISEVLAHGYRVSSPCVSAVISTTTAGYAVIVPKKVARLSVTRHRIKRRVLGALRSIPTLPPGLILFPTAAISSMKQADVTEDVSRLLSKIR